jgi:hypothetical protein
MENKRLATVGQLPYLNESYPVQVTKYAYNKKIATDPAFSRWVSHRMYKFGIKVPDSLQDALTLLSKQGPIFGAK